MMTGLLYEFNKTTCMGTQPNKVDVVFDELFHEHEVEMDEEECDESIEDKYDDEEDT